VAFAQQQKLLLPVAGYQNQSACRVEDQGFNHRQSPEFTLGNQLGDGIWPELSQCNRGKAHQAEGQGKGEDGTHSVCKVHVEIMLWRPAIRALVRATYGREGLKDRLTLYLHLMDMDITDIPLFAMLKSRMGYLTERQKVIAQNVANADTPRYQPQDLKPYSFQSHMAAAVSQSGPMSVAVTNPMHIAHTATSPNPPGVKSRKLADTETTLDGNSVVLEDEMLKLTDTRMNYDAAVGFYQKSLNLLRMATRAPGH